MNTPLILGLLVVLVVGLGGYVLYKRRSKSSDALNLPPPDIGDLVDYTKEDTAPSSNSLADRFRALSLPGKLLVGLLPLLLVVLCVWGGVALLQPESAPPPPQPSLAISKSDLVNPTTINIVAQGENIPDGTELRFELLADDQPLEWAVEDETFIEMVGGALDVRLSRGEAASTVDCSQSLAVRLSGDVNGQPIVARNDFFVPPLFELDFCASAEEPTPVPTRTPRPTVAASPTPAAPATDATPTAIPETQPEQLVAVQVGNGGNVRAAPTGEAEIVTQIVLGQTVDVLGRLADSSWYRIRTPEGVEGWTFAGALNPPAEVIEQIPVQDATGVAQEPPSEAQPEPAEPSQPLTPEDLLTPTTDAPAPAATEATGGATGTGDPVQVEVGNGGNVRAAPTGEAEIVTQIVLGQTVDVLGRLADNSWYRIRTPEGVEGWTFAGALNPPAELIEQIPVQNAQGETVSEPAAAAPTAPENPPPPPDPTTVVQLPLEASERTVVVYSGGQVHQEPSFDAPPAAQDLAAGETVELLSKTGTGADLWYKVRTLREEVGWAHNSLLTVPPDLASQLPDENPS